MATIQYIGAKYLPTFEGIWKNNKSYLPLSVVVYQGNSYTSKQKVPAGTPITDEEYWGQSGNYNAQLEAYRIEVIKLAEKVEHLEEMISDGGSN